jgi:UDP-2,4-diacetamido-2,4,6-trideoxy-beta-L-altropyranose hydrolase
MTSLILNNNSHSVCVILRADASNQMGVGHVMRCLTLADELSNAGAEIKFICRDLAGNLEKMILQRGYVVHLLPAPHQHSGVENSMNAHEQWLGVPWDEDANQSIKLISANTINWVIVDNYALDYRWHKKIRPYTDKIFVIDDLADRKMDCDMLLDQTFGRNNSDYDGLVAKDCQINLGSSYALLRPEFSYLRQKAIEARKTRRNIKNILVSVGALDPNNVTSQIITALERIKWLHKPKVNVVLHSSAPHLHTLLDQINGLKLEVSIQTDVSDMAKLMIEADLAIGAGGTTSWERCCLGLPTLLIKLADNQALVINGLLTAQAARQIDIENIATDLVRECEALQSDKMKLVDLSINSLNITDGKGTRLIALKMLSDYSKNNGKITLRPICHSDVDMIYNWQINPKIRKYFHNPTPPSYDEHCDWLTNSIADPTCYLYMIEHDYCPAGVLRLNYQVATEKSAEYYLVSVYIAPEHHNNGIGTIAINYANRLFRESELRAEIQSDNLASREMFKKSGYIQKTGGILFVKTPQQSV